MRRPWTEIGRQTLDEPDRVAQRMDLMPYREPGDEVPVLSIRGRTRLDRGFWLIAAFGLYSPIGGTGGWPACLDNWPGMLALLSVAIIVLVLMAFTRPGYSIFISDRVLVAETHTDGLRRRRGNPKLNPEVRWDLQDITSVTVNAKECDRYAFLHRLGVPAAWLPRKQRYRPLRAIIIRGPGEEEFHLPEELLGTQLDAVYSNLLEFIPKPLPDLVGEAAAAHKEEAAEFEDGRTTPSGSTFQS